MGSLLIFPGSRCSKILFVPSKCGVPVFPSPVEVLLSNFNGLQNQIPWGWFLVPLLDHQAGKPDVGLRTFTTVGELLGYYCSPVSGLPTWQVWIWFYHDCSPHTTSLQWPFFGHGYLFCHGFQCPPGDGCSTASWNFGALTRDKCTSFYTTILNQKPVFCFFNYSHLKNIWVDFSLGLLLLLLLSHFSGVRSVQPHRWQPTRLLCPWDFPGKSTGVGCHCLLCWVCYK